jgi:mono/diheme cytochrome c family protein
LVDNQLEAYDGLSLFSAPIGAASQYDAYSSSQDPLATLDRRARTYLAVNCAQCHQPGGPGSGGFDLRYDTPWLGTGLRDALPQQGSLGLPNARLVAPGNKASSVLWERLRRLDDTRMPPLGSHRVDDAAVELIGRWIDQLK